MLNIAEILKYAPKGTKLYSPLFGEVTFQGIDSDEVYPINVMVTSGAFRCFSRDGRFYCDYNDSECLLFPSKENRDWSTFKVKPEFPTNIDGCCEINGLTYRDEMTLKLNDLRYLLSCRDAWWKVDADWKPDWSNAVEEKSTITLVSNKICTCESYRTHCILAFRTPTIRNKFLETFRDLIEECKELL